MVGDALKKEFFDVLRASAPLGPTPGGHREIGLNDPTRSLGMVCCTTIDRETT